MISHIQEIRLSNKNNIRLFIKREDLVHPNISGNKYRKLKYNLKHAKSLGYKKILTFGGAFSNHIAATSYACKNYGFDSIGIIRGEELKDKINTNPTLSLAKSYGMQLKFVSRKDYRNKTIPQFINALNAEFGDFYLIPEGGTNDLAIKGCEEILKEEDSIFDFICCSVGTGGTICGLINTLKQHQEILGFSALKGDFLNRDIRKFVKHTNWELMSNYHFGGYGKIKPQLITFINTFKKEHGIPLDPIYTAKMMFGIFDLTQKECFPKHSKILAIHTGGLQGIKGMNIKLKQKGWPLIE